MNKARSAAARQSVYLISLPIARGGRPWARGTSRCGRGFNRLEVHLLIGWLALAAAVGLGLVHVFSNVLRTLDGVPRNRLLSAAGGMAVTFVVLQLLPSLTQHQ